jgi:phosphatidylglycerophosphate synthase
MKKKHSQYIKNFYRIIGDCLAPYLKDLNISANQITISRIFFIFAGSILILNDDLAYKLITLIFIIIFSLFDAADGSLARITKKSFLGMWLDTVIDKIGLVLVFLFFGIKLRQAYYQDNLYIIVNFLILILYFIKYSILNDISNKEKYYEFRKNDINLSSTSNVKISNKKLEKYYLKYLLKNFNFKNLLKFLHHQFSPHTANLLLYIGLINLFGMYKIGLYFLLIYYVVWIFRDIYKITKISIRLDHSS